MALVDLGKVPQGDGADEKKERRQILNHLFLLDEKLRYMFQNIDPEENFSPNAFQNYIDTGERITSLEVKDGEISAVVQDIKGNLSSLTITVEGIETHVQNIDGDISTIRQEANKIALRVENSEKGISQLVLRAEGIESSVRDVKGNLSVVSQKADKIDWIVAGGGSASRFTLTSRMAQLISDQIEIWGPVTFRDLETEGRTTIHGGNITTGKIDVEYLDLYGKIDVYERRGASGGSGGSFGFGRGANGGYGMLMENFYGSGCVIVTDDGARITFDRNAVYCDRDGVVMKGDVFVDDDIQVNYGNVRLMRGDLGIRRGDLYLNAEPIIKSDKRAKKDFSYDISAYEQLFFLLRPCSFRMIDGKSGRIHLGFISQEVEEALKVCGIPTEDFAGFVKTPIYEENEQGEALTEKEPLDFSYALRYGEFISLNTYMIQKLMIQVSNLEKRVEELEK